MQTLPANATVARMAARQARRNVVLTDQAKDALGEFRRALSVRLGADATYSDAILYAIKRTEAIDAVLEDVDGPLAANLEADIQLRMKGRRE